MYPNLEIAMPKYLLAIAVISFGAIAPHSAAAQASERHSLSGDNVSIWNLAGRAELVAGSGREVIVELTRGGDDGARLTVEASGGRLVVKYPARDIYYAAEDRNNYSSTLRVDDDGTFSNDWDDDRGGRRVRISSRGGDFEGHADLRIAVPQGQRVTLHLAVGVVEVGNVSGELDVRTQASTVTVRGMRGRLAARTGSGRVAIEDVEGERVYASTGSGSVRLADVRGGELRVSTGSGSVEGRNVRAERLHASTGSGGIEIEGLAGGEVRSTTGSGSVRLGFTSLPRDLTARTGSGSVTLTLPRDPNVELDIRTGSGGISTDYPVTMDQMRRNELRGRIGTGADGRFQVSTGSGSVRLRQP